MERCGQVVFQEVEDHLCVPAVVLVPGVEEHLSDHGAGDGRGQVDLQAVAQQPVGQGQICGGFQGDPDRQALPEEKQSVSRSPTAGWRP